MTYLCIIVSQHCVYDIDLEMKFCAKRIKNRIDLLCLTVQSLFMIEMFLSNRCLAFIMLFGVDAFNHVRYDHMYLWCVESQCSICFSAISGPDTSVFVFSI